ncbi:hypothetical protein BGW41_003443 [Actinomortierella wolfii]|nr:hypothetical protein BGW41_003443 [Actinomortierella wolfii]
MGWILYDPVPYADPSIDVPLGLTRRIIFLSVGAIVGATGLITTILFQILSKTNNDLRQRGRYLVTGQGVPDDEDGMLEISQTTTSQTATSGTVNSVSDSTASSNTAVDDAADCSRAKVSTEQSPEEAALAKKWYRRYWHVTDRRALWFFLGVYSFIIACGVVYQILNQIQGGNLAIYNPTSFNCHQSHEYYPPQLIAIIFVFIFSPALIYHLRGYSDGFGIRNDLMVVSIMGIPGIVLFVAVPIYAPEVSDKVLDRTTWVALILILSHIMAVIVPLVRYVAGSKYRCAFEAAYDSMKQRRKAKKLQRARESAEGGGVRNGHHPSTASSYRKRAHDIALETIQSPTDEVDTGAGTGKYNNGSTNNLGIPTDATTIAAQRRPSRAGGSSYFLTWSRPARDSLRYDWDAFVSALNDPEVFDKISAFTVGEFCAENTRFLAELSRLEKRAKRYERLRNMTVGGGAIGGTSRTHMDASQGRPYQFPPSDIEMNHSGQTTDYDPDNNNGGSRHRIKKIISVSSVSSSMPMLGASSAAKGRSSLSLDDFSEPPSPLGLPPVIRSPVVSLSNRYNSALDSLRTSVPLPEGKQGEEGMAPHNSIASPIGTSNTTTAEPSTTLQDGSHAPESQHNTTEHGDETPSSETTMAMAPLPMPPTLLIQYKTIYKNFIRHGGRLELNLSHDTYVEITNIANRGEWHAGMFESAKIEVYELLFRDVWSKFVSASHAWLSERAREGTSA